MIIKHWSFPLGNNESSTKDEVIVDIHINPLAVILKTIICLMLILDRISKTYKAEMKLNDERLDNRTIKIKKKKETFNLKGEGVLHDMQKVVITAAIDYTPNMNYMEKEEFNCDIEIEKL